MSEPSAENAQQTSSHATGQTASEHVVTIARRDVDVRKGASEQAEELLREKMREGSAFDPRTWGRKIGLRVLEEYWRQKLVGQIEKEMRAHNNSYLQLDITKSSIGFKDLFRGSVKNLQIDTSAKKTEEKQAGKAKIEETRLKTEELKQQGTLVEAQGQLRDMLVTEVLRPIVEGQITDEKEVQAKLREFVKGHEADPQVLAIFGRDATRYGKLADYFASDLLETGQAIKADIAAHRFAIEQLNENVGIQLANTRWAAETEPTFNAVDKAVAWAERHRLTGVLINPATIGAAFSLATFATMRATGASARAMQYAVPVAGLLPGALFAAVRRNYDLKVDMAAYRRERAYSKQIPQDAKRREALEKFAYSTASVKELITGGGTELITGTQRKALSELLKEDLNSGQVTNRANVIRRIAEIKSRLDFSSQEKIDLVTFEGKEQVEQGRLGLVKAVVEARIALRNAGMADAEIGQLETNFKGEWNQKFTQNKEQQDRSFKNYRLKQAIVAGAIGGVAGLGAGLISQQVLAGIGRNVHGASELPVVGALFGKGQTAAEKALHWGATQVGHEEFLRPMASIDTFKELYQNGGVLDAGNNLAITTNTTDHSFGFVDKTTNQMLPTKFPMFIDNSGHLQVMGDIDQLPGNIKDIVKAWDPKELPSISIREQIKEAIASGNSTEITQGNVKIDVLNNTATVIDHTGGILAKGSIDADGKLILEGTDKVKLTLIHDELTKQGFESAGIVDKSEVIQGQAGKGNVIDHLLSQSPDDLRKNNIIETDQFKKSWNFHVLRPDIVSSTGMHTHNELTLHVGGSQIHVLTGSGEVVRNGVGPIGQVNFGGEIHGGEIQSHLAGVDPAKDPVLNSLMQKSAGLRLNEMVAVVDLTNGKQIMLPLDSQGNMQLPKELYDPRTGSPRGVESIATAVLQKSDGTILKAQELLTTGNVPPGTVVHSLASERFAEGEIPKALGTEPRTIPKFELEANPPTAFDLTPPLEQEPPPIIPIPFSPRHPLEQLLFLYGYGGEYTRGEMGLLPWSEYKNRRSQKLISNPSAELNEREEINSYLNKQSSQYRQALDQIDQQLNKPMSENCRLVFAIPAFEEGKNIRKTLEQFLGQKDRDGNPLAPDLYEIIIFDNHPKDVPKDNTEEEMNRFQKEHPEVNVLYAHKEWQAGEAGVGNARKYANDLTLLRSIKRRSQSGDLILISNDADLDGISNRYVTDVINEFDSKKELDAIAGKWTLPDYALEKPNLRAGQRLWYILDRIIARDASGKPEERHLRTPGLVGRNAAFKASIYAAIGGYNPGAKIAEDLEIGWMINEARGWDPKRVGFLNSAELISNPRRFLAAMVQKIPLIQMYGGFHENREVRQLDNKQLLDHIPDNFDMSSFEKEADAIWQSGRSGQYKWLGDRLDALFARTMRIMGAEYKIENDHIKIINADRLIEGLKRPIPPINPPSPGAPPSTP